MKTKRLLGIAILVVLLFASAVTAVASGQDESMESSDTMENESMMEAEPMSTQFDVTIEVLSDSPTPLAPVAWAVHDDGNPFVGKEMSTRLEGLEALAEDGDPSAAAEALSMHGDVSDYGVANTPAGSNSPGPATPGSAYTFTVEAVEGQKLSFATMYVQSNDLFYSPERGGLALFDMSSPISADVTDEIVLYDAGTEVNEEPGVGANQPPRQSGPDTGKDEMGEVTPVESVDQMYMYPAASAVIRVTVQPHESM